MIKFSNTGDWDFGVSPSALAVDTAKLVKRASQRSLLEFEKTQNQTDLHIIQVGQYEGTGQNRNGDRFLEEDCVKKAHTFKKQDRQIHRHHKNKPTDPKYGNIKQAQYNPEMKRIELIVGLDNDKCGDVLQKIQSGQEVYWSMQCKIAHDVCSCCGHKARNSSERCEHIPSMLGELTKEGEMIGMINPDPNWFEQSIVNRPQDRIGFTLAKQASQEQFKGLLPTDYMNLYPGFQIPEEELLISKTAQDKRDLLLKVQELEKKVTVQLGSKDSSLGKYIKSVQPSLRSSEEGLSKETIDELRKIEPGKLFKVLQDNGVVLDPEDFINYLFGEKQEKINAKGVKSHLKNIATDICSCGESQTFANSDLFDPDSFSGIPKPVKNIINQLIGSHSLFDEPLRKRVVRIVIMGPKKVEESSEKTQSEQDKQIARTYMQYKIAQLNHMQSINKLEESTLLHAVMQNLC